jgi:hypothetical protein
MCHTFILNLTNIDQDFISRPYDVEMSITYIYEKGKMAASALKDGYGRAIRAVFPFLLGILFASLAVGGLSVRYLRSLRVPVTIDPAPPLLQADIARASSLAASASSTASKSPQLKLFVASKTGKSYYYPWCTQAEKILDKNKVWFETQDEAVKAGYSPSKSCKDLGTSGPRK